MLRGGVLDWRTWSTLPSKSTYPTPVPDYFWQGGRTHAPVERSPSWVRVVPHGVAAMANMRVMPTSSTLKSFGAATCVATLVSCLARAQPIAEISEHLRPPSAFSGIGDRAARSRALFAEAAKVITSPRCMNCHPAGDHPTQGNDEHVHQPAATRGEAGVASTCPPPASCLLGRHCCC
jgi:hypothetical protein